MQERGEAQGSGFRWQSSGQGWVAVQPVGGSEVQISFRLSHSKRSLMRGQEMIVPSGPRRPAEVIMGL